MRLQEVTARTLTRLLYTFGQIPIVAVREEKTQTRSVFVNQTIVLPLPIKGCCADVLVKTLSALCGVIEVLACAGCIQGNLRVIRDG